MRKVVAATALVLVILVADSQTARADPSSIFPPSWTSPPFQGATTRTTFINPQTAAPTATVTRLQPVVGSVQKSHFSNPITHKAKYTSVNYNPVLGTFGKQKFRR